MTSPIDASCQETSAAAPAQTILVIDDEPLILDLLVSWLTAAGFNTITAPNGEAGLALFRSQSVDLVLTDLVMPGSDGFQVLSSINIENPVLPVIIVSGAGNLQDPIKALRLGAWDYISKPMDHPLLFHQINKALERAALLKENAKYRQSLQHDIKQRTDQLKQQTVDLEQANLTLHREIVNRQHIENKLQEANDRWQITFDSMPDFISIHDRDFTVIKTNKALAQFLGLAPDAIIGKKCYQLFHGSCAPWNTCPHRELLVTGLPHNCEIIDPHIGRPLMVSVTPISNNGEIIGSIHIAKDISQQKRLEEERQKNKNLESISVLCGGLAHDFNNLLTAMSGYIDLAKREKAPDRLFHWLDNAKMVTKLAADLTKQLLIFAKGGSPLCTEISVPMLIQDSLDIKKEGFSQIWPEVCIAEDIWPIIGDHGQLRTVIRNVFYNAAESMPGGGTLTILAHNLAKATNSALTNNSVQSPIAAGANPPSLEFELVHSPLAGDAILLSFTDQGAGINPEIIDKVFDPYFTTSAKGATKGKGLGLALCHSIITKHHGLISVSSKKDQGTTVSIYLPANSAAFQP